MCVIHERDAAPHANVLLKCSTTQMYIIYIKLYIAIDVSTLGMAERIHHTRTVTMPACNPLVCSLLYKSHSATHVHTHTYISIVCVMLTDMFKHTHTHVHRHRRVHE